MSLLQFIREKCGLDTEIADSQIETLEKVRSEMEVHLQKAQDEFNDISNDLESKIVECGDDDASLYNKSVYTRKLESLEKAYHGKVSNIIETFKDKETLEAEILAKSVQTVALLPEEDQKEISVLMRVWDLTGIIKGQEYTHKIDAIVAAIDAVTVQDSEEFTERELSEEVNKAGGEGSRGGHVIGHTRSGKPIYDSPDHEAHKDFDAKDHRDAGSAHYKLAQEADNVDDQRKHFAKIDQHNELKKQKEKAAWKPSSWMSFIPHNDLQKMPEGLKRMTKDELVALNSQLDKKLAPFSPYGASDKAAAKEKREILKTLIEAHEKWESHDIKKAADYGLKVASLEQRKTGKYAGHYANAIVTRKDGKILFLKRAADKVVAPGQYCLPGGHIDEGETIQEACCRELEEEAGMCCEHAYLCAKAKADDGKWCFYLHASVNPDEVVKLLDGESAGAAWMSEEEWHAADLFFDLKDHLKAIFDNRRESDDNLSFIPTIKKSEEDGEYTLEKASFVQNPGSRGGKVIGRTKSGKLIYEKPNHPGHDRFTPEDHADAAKAQRNRKTQSDTNRYVWDKRAEAHERKAGVLKAEDEDDEELLVKGGTAASVGEKRNWGGIEYVKISQKRWVPTKHSKDAKKNSDKPEKRHATADLVAHAENTSSGQLKKVAFTHGSEHIRDAARREMERRKTEKDKNKPQPALQAAPKEADKKKDEAREVVKKKKAFDYSPSESLADPAHKKIEKNFGNKLSKNYERAAAKYERMFGNVLNTDNARELSSEYLKNKAELSAAVHEPSSAFIKKLYEDKLKERVPKGKLNSVYFTAGGTGAGKSTGLMGKEKSHHEKSHIVFDTNMNTFGSAKKKIDQALSAGKKVRINYTFRDPVDAFENGAVPRAVRTGRTVPIDSHIETHLGSMDTIQALKDHYKGNKNVHITVTDNSRGFGKARKMPITFVKQQEKKYVASDLREKLHEINKRLYESGEISESHYKGFRG